MHSLKMTEPKGPLQKEISSLCLVVAYFIWNSKSASVGGKHLVSSQTINSTVPFTVNGAFDFSLMRCLKLALASKYLIFIPKIDRKSVV